VILLLLILWPVAELVVMVEVAEAIGVIWMLLLLLVSWPIGVWAIRSQGRGVMRRLAAAIAEQRAPTREVLDGALVLVGGALLIIPGFIGDVLGAVLMLPPTRAIARAGIVRNIRSRLVVRVVGFGAGRQSYDVDSTARDIPPPTLQP
jgi:UPF0716 protein FxsA